MDDRNLFRRHKVSDGISLKARKALQRKVKRRLLRKLKKSL